MVMGRLTREMAEQISRTRCGKEAPYDEDQKPPSHEGHLITQAESEESRYEGRSFTVADSAENTDRHGVEESLSDWRVSRGFLPFQLQAAFHPTGGKGCDHPFRERRPFLNTLSASASSARTLGEQPLNLGLTAGQLHHSFAMPCWPPPSTQTVVTTFQHCGKHHQTSRTIPVPLSVPNIIIEHVAVSQHSLTPPFSSPHTSRWPMCGATGTQKIRAYSDSAMYDIERFGAVSPPTPLQQRVDSAFNSPFPFPHTPGSTFTGPQKVFDFDRPKAPLSDVCPSSSNVSSGRSDISLDEEQGMDISRPAADRDYSEIAIENLQKSFLTSEPSELAWNLSPSRSSGESSPKAYWLRKISDARSDDGAAESRGPSSSDMGALDTARPGDTTKVAPVESKSFMQKRQKLKKYLQTRYQMSLDQQQSTDAADEVFHEPSLSPFPVTDFSPSRKFSVTGEGFSRGVCQEGTSSQLPSDFSASPTSRDFTPGFSAGVYRGSASRKFSRELSPGLSPGLSRGTSRDISPSLSRSLSRDLSPGLSQVRDLSPGCSGDDSTGLTPACLAVDLSPSGPVSELSPSSSAEPTRIDDERTNSARRFSECGEHCLGIIWAGEPGGERLWAGDPCEERHAMDIPIETRPDLPLFRHTVRTSSSEQSMFTFPMINLEMFGQSIFHPPSSQRSFAGSPLLHSPGGGAGSTPPSPLVPSPLGIRKYSPLGSSVRPSSMVPPLTQMATREDRTLPSSRESTSSPVAPHRHVHSLGDYYETSLLLPSAASAPPSPDIRSSSRTKFCPFGRRQLQQQQKRQAKVAGPNTFLCPVCGRTLSSYNSLASHMSSHLPPAARIGGGGLQDARGKETAAGAEGGEMLEAGVVHVHLCKVCGRSFSRSDMLSRHTRLHTGLRPYECELCGQVFSRSDHLHTHQRTHTGEKPYRCMHCVYAAPRRDMVTRHMRVHLRESTGRGRRSQSASSYHSDTTPADQSRSSGRGGVRRQKPDLAPVGRGLAVPLDASQRQRGWSVTSSTASTDCSELSPAGLVPLPGGRGGSSGSRTWSTTSSELFPSPSYSGQQSVVWSPAPTESPDVFTPSAGSTRQAKHFVWPSVVPSNRDEARGEDRGGEQRDNKGDLEGVTETGAKEEMQVSLVD